MLREGDVSGLASPDPEEDVESESESEPEPESEPESDSECLDLFFGSCLIDL